MPPRHVLCVKTVEDQSGRYCIEGRTYTIYRMREDKNLMWIEAEGNILLEKNIDDNCFQFVN